MSEAAAATSITVTATLNGGTRDAATVVSVTATSGTATSGTDFAPVTGITITIPADSLSHTGTLSMTPTQDVLDEPDETVRVNGTTTAAGITVTGAAVTITDDDATPTVTLSLSDASISEDGGIATVTASLDHGSSVATTVTVSVAPDTPATSSDYSLSANRVLTIAADATSSTGTVTITGVDNDIDAADMTVQVKGAAVNSLDVTAPADVELTLEDDDTRGVTVSATSLDMSEGDDATYTVVLTSEPTADVTVTPSRSSGDTDVTVSGALTFTALNWSTAQTVTVSSAHDSDAADDAAVIGHAVSGGDYGVVTAASVDVAVDDDETPSSGVTLTVLPTSVSEAAAATPITVTATLNGGTRDAATVVSVTATSGTATSGTDFAPVTGITITIPANSLSHTGTLSMTPTQDVLDEPDETVRVNGTTTAAGITVTGAAVTITDDDATPTVTLSLSDASISEDGGIATVMASLDHGSSVATTVTVSVAPDTPATSSDYSLSTNRVLTIAADATSSTGTVTITGVDNDIDAADMTVQVKGAAVNSLDVTAPSDVELTLEDDDTRGVTVSATSLDMSEGDDATYTVVLTSEPTADVTVTPSRSSGDTDVTVSGALTFTALNWSTAQTVTVSSAHDSDAADDAAVIGHAVSGGDYGVVTAASVDVAVDDDETPSSGVTLTVLPTSVSEAAAATPITVTATLNGGTRDAATVVSVTATSGTATSGTDFAPVTGITITIPADSLSHTGTLSMTPTQDVLDEPDETVRVNGTTTAAGITVTGAAVTITDDDATPTVTLSLSDASISEDGGIATVTASLDHGSSVATTVTVSVAPDTPATSSDYSLSANRVLTIAADATSSTGTVTITGVDNDIDAADMTVQVKGAAVNSLDVTAPADVELTLEDDDTRGVTVSATSLDMSEGDDATYTVVLTSEPTADVTVTPSRSSGDTDVTVSGALTFTPINWNVAQTVTVSSAHDSDAADDAAVIGHAVSGGDYGVVTAASVDVAVDDDETPSSGVTLTVLPTSVSEAAAATPITVTATLNGGTRDAATVVSVTATSGTATSGTDFAPVTGITITIPANSLSHTGTLSMTPTQDVLDEPDETVRVNGTTTAAGITVTGAAVTITDDDTTPTVTLSLSDASISEDGGIATVMASLDHGSSVATTVTVSVAPDTPATSSDYSLSTNRVLTIAADATSSTGTVTITGVDNDIDAADMTVQVKGAAVNSLDVTAPSDVELTLEDDDTRGVTVSATSLDMSEGDDATYTVVLTSEPTADVTVTPSRSSGDTDVTVSGALTFTALNWSTAQTVTVSSAHDSDAADDAAVIGHAVSGGDYGVVTAASVDVAVDDDETPSSGVTLTVLPTSVSEAAAATPITVTATLNGGTRDAATVVSVTATSGTATSGTDFAPVTGITITIPADSLSHTGTLSMTPTQDVLDEPDETVRVNGTTTAAGITVTGAAVTITDDDATPTVTLSLSDASISEDGGIATVTASLDHGSSVATTVTVSVAPDTPATSSDYSLSANRVLTIAADATSSTGTVTITGVDNDIDAADMTVQVKGAAVNSLDVTAPADVELTLEDDDTRGVRVSATSLDMSEGDDATYTVVLTSQPTADVTVTPSRSSGDTDVTVSGALTFTPSTGTTAQTVTVSSAHDSDAADDAAVIGHAVSGGDYGVVTAASVDVAVDDDETPSSGVTLTVLPTSVSEGAAATPITVTATLNGGTRDAATVVSVTATSGTATSGTDFAPVTGITITIPANSLSHTGTLSMTPTQDVLDEPDETVSITGSATGITVTGAAVTITDDDTTPTVTLSLSDASISEGGGIATVMASLDHGSSVATTVTVSVAPDTPATSSDYSLSANRVLTIAADATSSTGTVTITGVDNDIDAADMTVQVKGAAVNSLDVTAPSDVELTLEDDDTRGVTVSATSLDMSEGDDATYTVVLTSQPTADVTVTPSRSSGDTDVTVSGALTFTALNWSTAQTVTVSSAHDSDAADDAAVIGHAVSGGDYGVVTAASVDVAVDDDETPSSGVTLSVSPDALSEGAAATPITVTATLNGGTRDAATVVSVTATSGTATSGTDFAPVTGITITIPANSLSHTGTLSMTPTQDVLDEPDETVSITGSATGITVTGAAVTITDDDATPTVTLSLSDASISEGGGIATVMASLDHGSSVATTVTVSVAPDTPATSSDYSLSANRVLTIAAESTASTGTVTITGVDNDIDAADMTVQVKGAAVNSLDVTAPSDVELTLEDDDTRGVTVSATSLDMSEGDDATYTVVLTSQPTADVTVMPSRSSGDTDVTVSGALTFTPINWSTAQTVTVSAAHDSDALDDAAVIGHAVSGGDYGVVTAASVDVAVDDDETPSSGVFLKVLPTEGSDPGEADPFFGVSEGADPTQVPVTAELDGGTMDTATVVSVTVGSGTATSGTDFASVTGFTITIPADSLSHTGTFTLTPLDDPIDEPDETVLLEGNVDGLMVLESTVTITDDDATPTVTLSLSDASISEDGGIATVMASLDHGSSVATTVTVSVAPDTPATSSDYSLSTNRVLTIAADATSSTGTVTITGVDNDIDAADMTVQVKGAAVNSLDVTAPSDVELTLEDDDTRGVTVSATSLDMSEGDDATYTVVLTSEPTADVTVTPSRSSGDTDVTVSGALTFTALNWSTAQTVTVSSAHDSDAADDAAVIGHAVSGGDYGVVTAASVDVAVDDDETPSSGVTLTVLPTSVSEAAAATPITVTATLNGGTRDAATVVSVTATSGTATSGTDFAPVTGITITIPANSLSHTGTLSMTPTQDVLDEPDETVRVNGTTTAAGITVTGAAVTITDDDTTPTVTLSLSDASISEDGGIATVTASLDHGSSVATTVTVSVAPDTPATSSDYSLSTNRVLTIAADATSSTGTVTITGVDNDIDAADMTVQVKGAAVNSLDVTAPADVELTLEDDDTRGVTVSATSLDMSEGDDATYTVVLTSEPTADVTVTPSRSSGDTDVTVSGALTFTALNWSTAQTVTVSSAHDSDAADDAAVIGHAVSGGDYGVVTAASVDVAVDDDETPSSGVTLTVLPTSVSEAAAATPITVTATLNGGTRDAATVVSVTATSGTATSGTDFAPVTGITITIPADSLSHTGTLSMTPTQDVLDEPDETVRVNGTTTAAGITVTGAAVTITDDDATPTVTLSLSDASISEDGGIATVTASLDHGSSVATTVTVSVAPDTPATSSDYSLSTNRVLTIAADATSSTGTVTITGVDNDIDAADMTVQVKGAAVNSLDVTAPADVELTLEDDDTRGVTVSATSLDMSEGDDATYTVVLTSEPTADVTVTPSRSSGDTDVTVSGALTFTALNWSTAQTVTVSSAHDSDAADDAAVIGHAVSGGDYGVVTAASVDVAVDDDETPSSGVTLSVSPDALSEGAAATPITVTATLNGGTRDAATVVSVTATSGTATSGTDFAPVTGITITIPANSLSHTGTLSMTPTQDVLDEPDETVSITGSATGITVTGAAVTITDDDATPTVTLSLSDASISEGGGIATVMASLDHGSSVATTVTVSVAPDTPATSSDYSLSANRVLTIAAESTASTGTVTITGVDNDIDAADMTVQVKGAAVNSLDVTAPSDVELTLEDDDTRGVTVSATSLDMSEGDDATYTVVLTSQPTADVTVMPSRSSGDTDVTVSGALTFTPINWSTAQTVTVSAAHDSDALDDAAVIGHAVSGGDYGVVTAASVDVAVDDDETPSSGVFLKVLPTEGSDPGEVDPFFGVSEGADPTQVPVTAELDGGTMDTATVDR